MSYKYREIITRAGTIEVITGNYKIDNLVNILEEKKKEIQI